MSKVASDFKDFRLEVETPDRKAFELFSELNSAFNHGGRKALEEAVVAKGAQEFVTIKPLEPTSP